MYCLKSICSCYAKGIVVGDFNVTGIDWSANIISNDYKSQLLLDFYSECGLDQLVSEPTRKNNILDLLFTSDPLSISLCVIDAPFCTSDHESILFSIYIEPVQNVDCPLIENLNFNWGRADWASLAIYCHQTHWNFIFSNCQNANDCWHCFNEILQIGLHQFVPFVSVSTSRPRTLHTAYVRKLIVKRKHVWQKKRNSPSLANKDD